MTTQLLTDAVRAAIESHLPSQTAGVLAQALAQADRDAKDLATLKDKHAALVASNQTLMADVAALRKDLDAHKTLDEREAAVAKAENQLKVRDLTLQIEAERKVSSGAFELMRLLTRNAEYRQSTNGTTPLVVPGYSGCGATVASGADSRMSTSEQV